MNADLELHTKGYLHHDLEIPSNAELCKQVFLAQPKTHQVKFVEKHSVVNDDILRLKEFFEDCHDTAINSGKTRESSKAKRRPRKMQRPRRVPIATIKTVTLGDSTIKAVMNVGLAINDIVKRTS
jgi:hypothetical protein